MRTYYQKVFFLIKHLCQAVYSRVFNNYLKNYFLKRVHIFWWGGEFLSSSGSGIALSQDLCQTAVLSDISSRPWGVQDSYPLFPQICDFKLFQRTLSAFQKKKNHFLYQNKTHQSRKSLTEITTIRKIKLETLKCCFLYLFFFLR